MCGFLFVDQARGNRIDKEKFSAYLNRQSWRGPDAQHVFMLADGRFLLGHNRLSVIDPASRSDQPMASRNGRYFIVYNGEIYNHLSLRSQLNLECQTTSDTETILEGFVSIGEKIFGLLDGMFAIVILDIETGHWVVARDAFGIKPLFISNKKDGTTVLGSEASVVAGLVDAEPCQLAVQEWRLMRRPLPGASFFRGVQEISPGTYLRSNGHEITFWAPSPSEQPFEQEVFESLVRQTITNHELSDVKNVSLISGGLDSAVITALSTVHRSYCIGMPENNEFIGAVETAKTLNREISTVTVTPESLRDTWRTLTRMRGEPLGLPNEGLIYSVCKAIQSDEKVVLTGEGADELLFGYDGIYRYAASTPWRGITDFLSRYGYVENPRPTERLVQYIETLRSGKSYLEFIEDFFYCVHLPGLLRRMDFASMAASKEARVPFVSKSLVNYMYRRPSEIKINSTDSKLPLRALARKLGLFGALQRKKIGFSAQIEATNTRFQEYAEFQRIVLETLKW